MERIDRYILTFFVGVRDKLIGKSCSDIKYKLRKEIWLDLEWKIIDLTRNEIGISIRRGLRQHINKK